MQLCAWLWWSLTAALLTHCSLAGWCTPASSGLTNRTTALPWKWLLHGGTSIYVLLGRFGMGVISCGLWL